MRLLSLIIIVSALAIVVARWAGDRRTSAAPVNPVFPTRQLQIKGPGNTLASVAQQVNDPKTLEYDPITRTAVAHVTLVVGGELQLGDPNDPAAGEVLEMATELCGDLRIKVQPGGKLRLYNSIVRTVSQQLSQGVCSRGYALFVDGTLEMIDSELNYISGSSSECLRGDAEATIRRSTFMYCDGSALTLVDVDGSRILVDESSFLGAGNWGVVVQGSGGEPVLIRNSLLEGKLGSVFVTGESAQVRLVDCTLGTGGIVFNGHSGAVETCWTRFVKVVHPQTGAPVAGVKVRAQSDPRAPVAVLVEATTDDQGMAELVLPEYIARPGEASKEPGRNTAGPLRISVVAADDREDTPSQTVLVSGKDATPIELAVAF